MIVKCFTIFSQKLTLPLDIFLGACLCFLSFLQVHLQIFFVHPKKMKSGVCNCNVLDNQLSKNLSWTKISRNYKLSIHVYVRTVCSQLFNVIGHLVLSSWRESKGEQEVGIQAFQHTLKSAKLSWMHVPPYSCKYGLEQLLEERWQESILHCT